MKSLVCTNDWSVVHEGEVDARVWHQVRLELGHINVYGTVESENIIFVVSLCDCFVINSNINCFSIQFKKY